MAHVINTSHAQRLKMEALGLLCGPDHDGAKQTELSKVIRELYEESLPIIYVFIDSLLAQCSEHSENSQTGEIDQARFKRFLKDFHATFFTKGSDAQTFIRTMYQLCVDPRNPCRKTLLEFYERSSLEDW